MVPNIIIFLIFLTITSVTAQTFQYSRGWTNGKRDGHKKDDVASNLILSPCQMRRLKYLLEGNSLNDRFYAPCDYHEEDPETHSERYKKEHSHEPLYEIFQ